MSKTAPSQYLHGTSPAEQARLLRLNQLINPACLAGLQLHGGERVLEIGSGLGVFARDMARVTGCPVVAVELDPGQVRRCVELAEEAGEASFLDLREGDVRDLPIRDDEWGSFDVVHGRFILEHVARPQGVVETLAGALRPGGRMVLLDDDHDLLRMWPPMPAVDELWRALIRAYVDAGNDPYVGRKLVSMMRVAGLQPARADTLFFGGCAGAEQWSVVVDNLVGVLEGAEARILESSAIAKDLFAEILDGLRAWAARPDSALWYQINRAEAVRPQ